MSSLSNTLIQNFGNLALPAFVLGSVVVTEVRASEQIQRVQVQVSIEQFDKTFSIRNFSDPTLVEEQIEYSGSWEWSSETIQRDHHSETSLGGYKGSAELIPFHIQGPSNPKNRLSLPTSIESSCFKSKVKFLWPTPSGTRVSKFKNAKKFLRSHNAEGYTLLPDEEAKLVYSHVFNEIKNALAESLSSQGLMDLAGLNHFFSNPALHKNRGLSVTLLEKQVNFHWDNKPQGRAVGQFPRANITLTFDIRDKSGSSKAPQDQSYSKGDSSKLPESELPVYTPYEEPSHAVAHPVATTYSKRTEESSSYTVSDVAPAPTPAPTPAPVRPNDSQSSSRPVTPSPVAPTQNIYVTPAPVVIAAPSMNNSMGMGPTMGNSGTNSMLSNLATFEGMRDMMDGNPIAAMEDFQAASAFQSGNTALGMTEMAIADMTENSGFNHHHHHHGGGMNMGMGGGFGVGFGNTGFGGGFGNSGFGGTSFGGGIGFGF